MNTSISFKKIWQDEDMVELTISVSDGTSLFQCNTYVGHQSLTETVKNLLVFKDHVYGGLYDLRFGEFGPEYANGAFHARMEMRRINDMLTTAFTGTARAMSPHSSPLAPYK